MRLYHALFPALLWTQVVAKEAIINISTLAGLDSIRHRPNLHYVLSSNIDASATKTWNDSGTNDLIFEGWRPFRFTGILNGNGHKIANLHINRRNYDRVGLFTTVSGDSGNRCTPINTLNGEQFDSCGTSRYAEIKNLSIHAESIIGANRVGIIAGEARNAHIINCDVAGLLEGADKTGGLIGHSGPYVSVEKSSSRAKILGRDDVGGAIGTATYSWIDDFKSDCELSARDRVGGVLGSATGVRLERLVSRSIISGRDSVGGIIGITIGSNHGRNRLKTQRQSSPPILLARIGFTNDDGQIFARYPPYIDSGLTIEGNDKIISQDTRVSNSVFQGEIRCERWCGGIRGGGRDFPFGLVRCINSGLIRGQSHVGGISGWSRDVTTQMSLIQAGLTYGDSSASLFGDSENLASDVFIASPVGDRLSCRDLFFNCEPKKVSKYFGTSGNYWAAPITPSGLWAFEYDSGHSSLFQYQNCKRRKLTHQGYTDWNGYSFLVQYTFPVGSDPKFHTRRQSEIAGVKFRSGFLPPIRKQNMPILPDAGCVSMSNIFMPTNHSEAPLKFRVVDPSGSYTARADSVCRVGFAIGASDSVQLEVRTAEGGLLRVELHSRSAATLNREGYLSSCVE